MRKKLNNGGKRHIRQQCKARYKSKVVKLIERYEGWWSRFSSLFNLEKSLVSSLCYSECKYIYMHCMFTLLLHCSLIPLLGYLFMVNTHKFEIPATILIMNILPI